MTYQCQPLSITENIELFLFLWWPTRSWPPTFHVRISANTNIKVTSRPAVEHLRFHRSRHPDTPCARSADGERSEEHTLNSSHSQISYAVFCLKKKKKNNQTL